MGDPLRPYPRLDGVETNALGERMIAFFEKYYPHKNELYVTTSLRRGDNGSYHGGTLFYGGSPTMAVDLGGYDDPEPNDKDQRDMGLASDWLYEHFWDLTVELIHTQPHNDHSTYVKFQNRVGPYAAADHVNHIHWATSAYLMGLIEARARELWGEGPFFNPTSDEFVGLLI